jgi:hypothetical protein
MFTNNQTKSKNIDYLKDKGKTTPPLKKIEKILLFLKEFKSLDTGKKIYIDMIVFLFTFLKHFPGKSLKKRTNLFSCSTR